MATAQFFCDLPSKTLCQACWDANLQDEESFIRLAEKMAYQ